MRRISEVWWQERDKCWTYTLFCSSTFSFVCSLPWFESKSRNEKRSITLKRYDVHTPFVFRFCINVRYIVSVSVFFYFAFTCKMAAMCSYIVLLYCLSVFLRCFDCVILFLCVIILFLMWYISYYCFILFLFILLFISLLIMLGVKL